MSNQVTVIAADTGVAHLNTWRSQEGICKIIEKLAILGAPKVDPKTPLDLSDALKVGT